MTFSGEHSYFYTHSAYIYCNKNILFISFLSLLYFAAVDRTFHLFYRIFKEKYEVWRRRGGVGFIVMQTKQLFCLILLSTLIWFYDCPYLLCRNFDCQFYRLPTEVIARYDRRPNERRIPVFFGHNQSQLVSCWTIMKLFENVFQVEVAFEFEIRIWYLKVGKTQLNLVFLFRVHFFLIINEVADTDPNFFLCLCN